MNELTFLNFLDLERLEKINDELMKIDLSKLDQKDLYYVTGAMDGLMSVTGVKNKLTKFLNIDPKEDKARNIEYLKELNLKSEPDAVDITESLDFPKFEKKDDFDEIETVEELAGLVEQKD